MFSYENLIPQISDVAIKDVEKKDTDFSLRSSAELSRGGRGLMTEMKEVGIA